MSAPRSSGDPKMISAPSRAGMNDQSGCGSECEFIRLLMGCIVFKASPISYMAGFGSSPVHGVRRPRRSPHSWPVGVSASPQVGFLEHRCL